MKRKINIVLTGVGGQGVITAANILGKAAVNAKVNVYASEVHGMAQRGCPVICIVRMGNVSGPLLLTGTADAILSTEPIEALRNIKYAHKKTHVITDIKPVVPFTVSLGLESYPDIENVFKEIRSCAKLYTLDALKIAKNAGASVTKNIVMLGALSASDVLPFTPNILLETILDTVPQKYKEINKKAFEEGLKDFQLYKATKIKRGEKQLRNKRKYVFISDLAETKYVSPNIMISVVTNTEDFKDFFQVPWIVYKDDKYWVAPLWPEMRDFFKKKNPFWTHAETQLFVAYKNNIAVGRVAAFIDYKFCETVGEKIGYFGFFECVQDFKCAEALWQSAQNWLGSKGMKVMRGPIDGRVDVGCGFLYTGFDSPPSLLSSYSPSYYISFAEKFNMKKARDQLLYYIDLTKPIPAKLKEKAQQCAASGIKIRSFNRLRTKKELNWWIELFLKTFVGHWGYVPVSSEEVRTRFGVKQLRWFVDSRLFLVAEFNDSPVAYLWSTPDYNQIFQKMNGRLGPAQLLQVLSMKSRINKGKLHLIGIKKEFRNQNIGSYLNYETLVEMKRRGYVGAEIGWVDERNTVAHTTIAVMGAKLYKKFRVFDKNILNGRLL